MMQLVKKHAGYLLGLTLLGYLLFMWGNGNYSLFDNSEPHYARISQEMAQTKQYLTLTFNGKPWFVHPPLYFWICSTWCRLWGWTEFNLRFTEGVFGILGLWGVYALGRRFFSTTVGVAGASILATSLYYTVMSRLGIFDTLFNTMILSTLVFFFLGFYQAQNRFKWFICAALSTGLSVLTKGPFGLIQPLMGIVPFLLWKRQLKILWSKELLLSFGLFFLLVCPWYAYELKHFGWEFFNVALKDYTWYRVFGVVEAQGGPWYFYFPVLMAYFPWIFFLPGILSQGFTALFKKDQTIFTPLQKDFVGFSWIWIVLTFIFFSVTGTKLPNYIMGIFPFMSILTAFYLLNKPRVAVLASSIPLFATALLIVAVRYPLPAVYMQDRPLILNFFGVIFATTWLFWLALVLNKRKLALGIMTAGAVLWGILLVGKVLPAYEKYKDIPDIIRILKQPSNLPTVNYDVFSPSLYYYLNTEVPSLRDMSEVQHARVVIPTDDLKALDEAGRKYLVLFKGIRVSLIQL